MTQRICQLKLCPVDYYNKICYYLHTFCINEPTEVRLKTAKERTGSFRGRSPPQTYDLCPRYHNNRLMTERTELDLGQNNTSTVKCQVELCAPGSKGSLHLLHRRKVVGVKWVNKCVSLFNSNLDRKSESWVQRHHEAVKSQTDRSHCVCSAPISWSDGPRLIKTLPAVKSDGLFKAWHRGRDERDDLLLYFTDTPDRSIAENNHAELRFDLVHSV